MVLSGLYCVITSVQAMTVLLFMLFVFTSLLISGTVVSAVLLLPAGEEPELDPGGLSWEMQHGRRWTWAFVGGLANAMGSVLALIGIGGVIAVVVATTHAGFSAFMGVIAYLALMVLGTGFTASRLAYSLMKRQHSSVTANQHGVNIETPWPGRSRQLEWRDIDDVRATDEGLVLDLGDETLFLSASRHDPEDVREVGAWLSATCKNAKTAPPTPVVEPPKQLRRLLAAKAYGS